MTDARRFLVIGAGGREHALAWRLAQADSAARVFVAPGNDGIAADASLRGGCVPIQATDLEGLARFAREQDITLTIVGPEAPLVAGVVDHFLALGLPIFGPSAQAAQLEASKTFAKEVMDACGVPTARWASFDQLSLAVEHARHHPHPLVIKADGLAAGKGVFISPDAQTSVQTLHQLMAHEALGQAGRRVILEEHLEGEELSFIVATDGVQIVALPTSQDHKRALDGDRGPNTGGMGAYTPSRHEEPAMIGRLKASVIRPVLDELARRGSPLRGFLYAGLMLTPSGPRVLEFNVRLGDPEAQALLFGLDAPLGEVLIALQRGEPVDEGVLLEHARPAFCVVLAAHGYPGEVRTGDLIEGLEQPRRGDVMVFCAGVKRVADRWVTASGRALGVTARGASAELARQLAYEAADTIRWPGIHYRRDMGQPRQRPGAKSRR